MEEPEFSCDILSKLDLDDIENVVKETYHRARYIRGGNHKRVRVRVRVSVLV